MVESFVTLQYMLDFLGESVRYISLRLDHMVR